MNTTDKLLTRDRLAALLAAMGSVRIGVVGDAALDVYWDADMTLSGLARENPHHFLPIVAERLTPGGGSNAAACTAALGASVRQLGLVGDDWRGRELARLLPAAGVSADYLVISPERTTAAFCKPVRHGLCEAVYEDPHLYFENRTPTPPAVEAELLARLETLLGQVDAVLVSDYHACGVVTPALRDRLCAAGRAGVPVLVDSRPHLDQYRHVILKPNEVEAAWATGASLDPRQAGLPDFIEIAGALARQQEATVCLTLGARGCLWAQDGTVRHIPTQPVPAPIDTVGAGDAFGAACLTALAAGATGPEAAALGHLAARVVVKKLGVTGTATAEEILGNLKFEICDRTGDPHPGPPLSQRGRAGVGVLHRKGHMHASSTYPPFTSLVPLPAGRPAVRAVLFDFDGTISTLRQGWEDVMAPLMVEMIAGPTEPTEALRQEVAAYIDRSTGVQTIHQMVWLAETVACRGLNPRVLGPWEYKAEYNRRLMAPVQARLDAVAAGAVAPDDFMIAGSRAFLDALRAAGLTLYVASGTDHADVIHEAAALGVADYFAEIAGAPTGAMDCSKEAVLRRLVQEAGLHGQEVAVIGDGRVEIALAREVGALALGVATDEEQRHGINPAKYARLERAGAHAITGDFTELETILAWLNID